MTEIYRIESNQMDHKYIAQAAKAIQNGKLVVFPTETVYGLGANGLDEDAVEKIFIAKGRPSDNPMILHIHNEDMLKSIVKEIPLSAKKLMKQFWPGPLTLIFKKARCVPYKVTGGLDTVAVRMPSNDIALRLIQEANLPIAAPSANLSGKPSPTKSEHVIEDLKDRVDIIIASKQSEIGLESTVLDLTDNQPTLLRPGAITIQQLTEVLGQVILDDAILSKLEQFQVRSPGMKYKHYAPQAPLTIISGETENVINEINKRAKQLVVEGKKIGIIATEETKHRYNADIVINLGDRSKSQDIMRNLFDVLREFDKQCVDVIFSEGFSIEGAELAISNRLVKASGYDIIQV